MTTLQARRSPTSTREMRRDARAAPRAPAAARARRAPTPRAQDRGAARRGRRDPRRARRASSPPTPRDVARRPSATGALGGDARPAAARREARRGDGARASKRSPRCPIRSAPSSRAGRGPTGSTSRACACRSASSASSTSRGPTSPPMPAGCACTPAMRRSCAAARKASIPRARSPRACARGIAAAGLPEDAVQLVPTRDRAAVGHDARHGRSHRRDRAARRPLADRARAAREPHPGDRASRRHLPHLCRPRRRSRHGARASCSTPRCGAPASAARPRRCWSTAPSRRRICRRSSPICTPPAARCAATTATRALDPRR